MRPLDNDKIPILFQDGFELLLQNVVRNCTNSSRLENIALRIDDLLTQAESKEDNLRLSHPGISSSSIDVEHGSNRESAQNTDRHCDTQVMDDPTVSVGSSAGQPVGKPTAATGSEKANIQLAKKGRDAQRSSESASVGEFKCQ